MEEWLISHHVAPHRCKWVLTTHPSLKVKQRNGSVDKLGELLVNHPALFRMYECDNGDLILSYELRELKTAALPGFHIKNWERGLKHAGFEFNQRRVTASSTWILRNQAYINIPVDLLSQEDAQ